MQQPNDLLIALKHGDTNAFRMMYDTHYPLVAKIAARYLSDPAEMNSVANDAFLKLWKFGGNLASDSSIPAWLHTITKHLCLDMLHGKKAVRNVPLQLTDAVPETPEEMVFTTDLLLETAILQEAYRLIGALPPLQRNVLTLYFIEDRTIAEIAVLLGKPPRNISNAKIKGLANLKAIMLQKFQHTDYELVIWPIVLMAMFSMAGS